MRQINPDRMSNLSFRLTELTFRLADLIYPTVSRRVERFGVPPGITLVDYGCGPGRYTVHFARLVGKGGRVYAVDVQPLAIAAVQRKIVRLELHNVVALLAHGYNSGLSDQVADIVCAIDMFHSVSDSGAFLAELRRIIKADGLLIIDDGHQPRAVTKTKLAASGVWRIAEETQDHLRCQPL